MESAVPEYILDTVRLLPPLPAAVERLLELARDPNSDFRLISDVIETDQTLTARTLRAANSALYGVTRRVQTVRQAIVLLGRDAVMGLAIGASVLGLQNSIKRRWPLDSDALWRHTVGVAIIARTMASQLGVGDPDEAFVAGLLHDIGKIIMLDHFGELYGQVLMTAQYGANPLHVIEREVFSTDHAVVGHALCLHWNIPSAITRAVAEHHEDVDPAPNSLADIVRDANEIMKLFAFADGGNRFVQLRTSRLLPHNQIRPDRLREMIVELPGAVKDAELVFGSVPAGNRLANEDRGDRPLVHMQITVPEERDMLVAMLWGMGYEPVMLNDTLALPRTSSDEAALAGVLTDIPLSPERQFVYRSLNIPILDYSAWRGSRQHLIPVGHFNVFDLRAWITSGLMALTDRVEVRSEASFDLPKMRMDLRSSAVHTG